MWQRMGANPYGEAVQESAQEKVERLVVEELAKRKWRKRLSD
jgi:hypothetical protein